MKKTLLSTIFLFCSLFVFADNIQTIVLKPTPSTSTIKRPRSGVVIPRADVDVEQCQLTISMMANDSYTLYVYDNSGRVVCQESVVTDGGRHTYFLPELEADLYTISIEDGSNSYEGEFFVY